MLLSLLVCGASQSGWNNIHPILCPGKPTGHTNDGIDTLEDCEQFCGMSALGNSHIGRFNIQTHSCECFHKKDCKTDRPQKKAQTNLKYFRKSAPPPPTPLLPVPTPAPSPNPPCSPVKVVEESTGEIVPCVFPFKVNGKTFNACTREGSKHSKLWCSTRVDALGLHEPEHFGICEMNGLCLTELTTCATLMDVTEESKSGSSKGKGGKEIEGAEDEGSEGVQEGGAQAALPTPVPAESIISSADNGGGWQEVAAPVLSMALEIGSSKGASAKGVDAYANYDADASSSDMELPSYTQHGVAMPVFVMGSIGCLILVGVVGVASLSRTGSIFSTSTAAQADGSTRSSSSSTSSTSSTSTSSSVALPISTPASASAL